MKKINVGIIGFGTIGSGVVKALKARRSFLREKTGIDLSIAWICDKDLKTKRPVKVEKKLLTKFLVKVLHDPKVDIVVELMGGVQPARDAVMEALRQGKHVVTANKALLSDSGYDIFSLANSLGLAVGFEASVGGGIPIIRALKEGFVANKIDLIYGIINGTSNFILSKMADEGLSFKDALLEAQERGYAEKDPRLDVSGGDSCHKLSVLAMLGFGVFVKADHIYTEGIEDIEPIDIEYAKHSGYTIKLLAIAKRTSGGLEMRVHPTLIPQSHLLASVNGVYNAIFVKGDLVGENLFYGQGAGANPTSSAVVSDIITIARNICCNSSKSQEIVSLKKDVERIKDMSEIKTRFYIRFSALDKPGVLANISSVIQKERKAESIVPIIMMTHEAYEKDMAAALKEIDSFSVMKKRSVRVRIEG